jgi:purine-binding chemotaxis protein CheW
MLEHAIRSEKLSVGASRSAASEFLQVVSFNVGEEEFGIEILSVQEIIRLQDLTRVPNSPKFVDGVINLRGKVIPVIALRKRFGLPQQTHDKETRIVVLETHSIVIGLIVDSVSEVLRVPTDAVVPPPRLGPIEKEFVSGVAKLDDRLLILLDLERIVTAPNLQEAAAEA